MLYNKYRYCWNYNRYYTSKFQPQILVRSDLFILGTESTTDLCGICGFVCFDNKSMLDSYRLWMILL